MSEKFLEIPRNFPQRFKNLIAHSKEILDISELFSENCWRFLEISMKVLEFRWKFLEEQKKHLGKLNKT